MSKGIELTQSQIKSYENGATMFMFPLNNCNILHSIDEFPIQKGDKDIYIKEEFGVSINGTTAYLKDYTKVDQRVIANLIVWKPASQMTKEQSRYTIKECIDVGIVRVQDISIDEMVYMGQDNKSILEEHNVVWHWIKEYYNNQLKEQNINRTYEDNDYIFLCEVTPLKEVK